MKTVAFRKSAVASCLPQAANTGGPTSGMARLRYIIALSFLLLIIGHLSGCGTSESVPEVLVGPVDLRLGIAGIAAKGMPRDDVIKKLGSPLESRESPKDAEERGSSDYRTYDYFAGIYADAYWFNDDRLSGLDFSFDRFRGRFGVELKVCITHRDRSIILSRRLTIAEAKSTSFRQKLGVTASQVENRRAQVRIKLPNQNDALVLLFSQDDGHLESVSICW